MSISVIMTASFLDKERHFKDLVNFPCISFSKPSREFLDIQVQWYASYILFKPNGIHTSDRKSIHSKWLTSWIKAHLRNKISSDSVFVLNLQASTCGNLCKCKNTGNASRNVLQSETTMLPDSYLTIFRDHLSTKDTPSNSSWSNM